MLLAQFIEDANQHFSVEQTHKAFPNPANQSLADTDFCQEFVNNVKQAGEAEAYAVM